MPGKRASAKEIVGHFEGVPRAAGPAEERVKVTAKHFKVTPATVHKHLRFWWPGKKYVQEFGERKPSRAKWDRPTEQLLAALNRHGSVARASRALKTTAVTLTRTLERHRIVQRWVVDGEGEDVRVL